MPMTINGHNGNNETLTGNSSSTSLALFDDSFNEIPIKMSSVPIDVIIKRDTGITQVDSFQYVNASDINNNLPVNSLFLQNKFDILSKNVIFSYSY
jgi:hypothetical protein